MNMDDRLQAPSPFSRPDQNVLGLFLESTPALLTLLPPQTDNNGPAAPFCSPLSFTLTQSTQRRLVSFTIPTQRPCSTFSLWRGMLGARHSHFLRDSHCVSSVCFQRHVTSRGFDTTIYFMLITSLRLVHWLIDIQLCSIMTRRLTGPYRWFHRLVYCSRLNPS